MSTESRSNTSSDSDELLRRLERRALIFCLAAAAVMGIAFRQPDVALGVLGGGALTAGSYWAIRASVTGLLALIPSKVAAGAPLSADSPENSGEPQADSAASWRPNPVKDLLRVVSRYALLALAAYVMIARLRLSPVGLLIGASSLFVATTLEAFRFKPRARRDRPRA
jgi:hypothetical protein